MENGCSSLLLLPKNPGLSASENWWGKVRWVGKEMSFYLLLQVLGNVLDGKECCRWISVPW